MLSPAACPKLQTKNFLWLLLLAASSKRDNVNRPKQSPGPNDENSCKKMTRAKLPLPAAAARIRLQAPEKMNLHGLICQPDFALSYHFFMDYFLPPCAFIGIERKIWFCDMNEFRTNQNVRTDEEHTFIKHIFNSVKQMIPRSPKH